MAVITWLSIIGLCLECLQTKCSSSNSHLCYWNCYGYINVYSQVDLLQPALFQVLLNWKKTQHTTVLRPCSHVACYEVIKCQTIKNTRQLNYIYCCLKHSVHSANSFSQVIRTWASLNINWRGNLMKVKMTEMCFSQLQENHSCKSLVMRSRQFIMATKTLLSIRTTLWFGQCWSLGREHIGTPCCQKSPKL